LRDIVKYALLPALALATAHWIAVRPRSLRLVSIVDFQYFAAGIVLSAVSAELLPQIFARHNPLWVVMGFLAGMGLAHVTAAAVEKRQPVDRRLLATLLLVNGCMAGLLVGAAFVAGPQQGRLLSLALVGRAAFVGLNTPYMAGVDQSRSFTAGLATLAACGVLVTLAVLNYEVLSRLPHRVFDGMLAFALSGILYLTTRDLLLEIQDELQAGLRTRLFCLGYVLFLVLHMVAISPTEPEPIP
jgi:zinc transporter ZupT